MNNQLDLFAVLGAYQSARDVVALLLSLICDSKLKSFIFLSRPRNYRRMWSIKHTCNSYFFERTTINYYAAI